MKRFNIRAAQGETVVSGRLELYNCGFADALLRRELAWTRKDRFKSHYGLSASTYRARFTKTLKR